MNDDIEEIHKQAVLRGEDQYVDPVTKYKVFTSLAAERRGKCCGLKCRHCPYGHFNVKNQPRSALPVKATLLLNSSSLLKSKIAAGSALTILFWSSGKDSYLTYLSLLGDSRPLLLATSFDAESGIIAEQNVHISSVYDQVHALKADLLAIPLKVGVDYVTSVKEGINLVETMLNPNSVNLAFGDLHLKDICDWRNNAFTPYSCIYPIFGVPYKVLKERLFVQNNVKQPKIYFSAINNPLLKSLFKVGEEITLQVMDEISTISPKLDEFGENGEYHSFVKFEKKE
jgi:diphthamide synthase (EF-2-diphthine--ammonia ligase)